MSDREYRSGVNYFDYKGEAKARNTCGNVEDYFFDEEDLYDEDNLGMIIVEDWYYYHQYQTEIPWVISFGWVRLKNLYERYRETDYYGQTTDNSFLHMIFPDDIDDYVEVYDQSDFEEESTFEDGLGIEEG